MPLGNLTSQFFANIYLNELDQFVKHRLKAKYYIRYVDDFVILHNSKTQLELWKIEICKFINEKLKLELHPDKSKIIKLNNGINFLGLRIFYNHKLIRKKNLRKFEKKFIFYKELYENGEIGRDKIVEIFEGWIAYVSHADTYKYRRYITREFNRMFPATPENKIENTKKEENLERKTRISFSKLTIQKTIRLFKKGLNIKQIAEKRQIKESTVYKHLEKLIGCNQISIFKVLNKDKIFKIKKQIYSKEDTLKGIKARLKDNSITYDEISLVLASIKYSRKRVEPLLE